MTKILADMKAKTETVIETVSKELADDFPVHIRDSIFSGLRQQAARLP